MYVVLFYKHGPVEYMKILQFTQGQPPPQPQPQPLSHPSPHWACACCVATNGPAANSTVMAMMLNTKFVFIFIIRQYFTSYLHMTILLCVIYIGKQVVQSYGRKLSLYGPLPGLMSSYSKKYAAEDSRRRQQVTSQQLWSYLLCFVIVLLCQQDSKINYRCQLYRVVLPAELICRLLLQGD